MCQDNLLWAVYAQGRDEFKVYNQYTNIQNNIKCFYITCGRYFNTKTKQNGNETNSDYGKQDTVRRLTKTG